MKKPRYARTVALTLAEEQTTEKLQKKGIKVIDIFRAGLEAHKNK